MADEIAAEVGFVLIHHHGRDVVHVEAQRIAEQQDEQQRDREGQIKAAYIPDQMIKDRKAPV